MSPRAAWRLETLGFTAVHDYVAGKADWTAAGLPTEGRHGRGGLPGFVTGDIVTTSPDELVGAAVERAASAQTETLVVVNHERVVLGRLRAPHAATRADERVITVMEEGPTTVRADVDAEDLLNRMRARDVAQVLMTTPEGRLLGAIHRRDLGAHISKHAPTP